VRERLLGPCLTGPAGVVTGRGARQGLEVLAGELVDGSHEVDDLVDPGVDDVLRVWLAHDDEARQEVVLDGRHGLGQPLEGRAHLGEC
jgi:hypothetical protein